jgi:hypothetical protein
MRDLGGLILIFLAVVVVLMWAVLYGPLRDSPLFRPQKAPPSLATAPPNQEAAPAKPGSVPSRRGESRSDTRAELTDSGPMQSPAASAPTAPLSPAKFPTAVELPLGMRRSEVLASFGQPVARTIGVDQNGQNEILIYRRTRPDAATVAHIRNGRVVSAVTMPY